MLLAGPQAIAALRELLTSAHDVVGLEIDPGARTGKPLELLAAATLERAILIDARATLGLGEVLRDAQLVGAHRAGELHRALLRRAEPGPARWACTHLSELLLAGGRPGDPSLEGAAARLGLSAPRPADAGFDALQGRAQTIAQVIHAQIPELRKDALGRVSKIEAAAVAPVAEMEHAGMAVDAARWRALCRQADLEREALRAQLSQSVAQVTGRTLFGEADLNFEADLELKQALHALGHPVENVRRTTLETLPPPWGTALVRYRELTKLVTAYGERFLEHVHPDGRVHPTFEQIGASTGRMACHAPNLQAVVKDAAFRACFTAPPGFTLVIADYATCELRILAQVSGDPVFKEAFARGDDLHATVASSLFRQPVSKSVNPELRQRAKAINFGLVYGMGAEGLARQIETDRATAAELLETYFRTFPNIRRYLEDSARQALRRGYAQTLTGRRLYLDAGGTSGERAQAERVAKNMPIQGTNADITKIALARLRGALWSAPGARLVNAVHDEIVVECPAAEGAAIAARVRHEMMEAAREVVRDVPMEVDAIVSDAWDK